MDCCSLVGQLMIASGMVRPVREVRLSPIPRKVLDYLRSDATRSRRQQDIRRDLGLRHPTACWALLMLRKDGLVQIEGGKMKNPRYFLYRAA